MTWPDLGKSLVLSTQAWAQGQMFVLFSQHFYDFFVTDRPKHVKYFPNLFHCSPATWQSRIPVQWFTSSPVFLQSAWGSLWKGGSSVHSSCLICCMLPLLLWQQKDFHWPQQDLELFCVLQVSDSVAVLTMSSLTNIVSRMWSRGKSSHLICIY